MLFQLPTVYHLSYQETPCKLFSTGVGDFTQGTIYNSGVQRLHLLELILIYTKSPLQLNWQCTGSFKLHLHPFQG